MLLAAGTLAMMTVLVYKLKPWKLRVEDWLCCVIIGNNLGQGRYATILFNIKVIRKYGKGYYLQVCETGI